MPEMPETPGAPEEPGVIKSKETRWGAFWWAVSVTLHVAGVAALIYLTPLREWFFKDPDPKDLAISAAAGKVREIVGSIIAIQERKLRDGITQQRFILDELTAIRDGRYVRFSQEVVRRTRAAAEPVSVLGSAGPEVVRNLSGKGLAQLYEIAQVYDRTTHGTYRHVRALELARIQQLPLAEASDATQIQVPTHPPLDVAVLTQVIESVQDKKYAALRKELQKVEAEVTSMVASAQRMLDLAQELVAADIGGTTGGGEWGTGPTAFGGEGELLGRERQPLFAGYSAPDPDHRDHSWGDGVGPVVHKGLLFPKQESVLDRTKRPLPGRKLMAHGERSEWMYIDQWYIIGPFANPNRENLDKKFPPESGVDLDAVYIGKDGRVLIIPHQPADYAIWYACTEIWSDKDEKRWCIFGSDDYGKTWVNDELVYASGKTPHEWIPDRAYKEVQFRRGPNQVLFKVENAWGRTGFSMCVYLGQM
jgi:hypothetical protein